MKYIFLLVFAVMSSTAYAKESLAEKLETQYNFIILAFVILWAIWLLMCIGRFIRRKVLSESFVIHY